MPPRKSTRATDEVAKICSSVIPTQSLKAENFWRLLAEYPHRDAAMVYVYRLKPKIDRTKTNNHSNIAKWPLGAAGEPAPDETRLLDEFGSGLYHLRLSDSNRPKQMTEVANSKININRPDHPAVLDPAELVMEAEENRSYIQWCRAKGLKLPGDGDEMKSAEGVAVTELAGLSRELLEELKDRGQQPAGRSPIELAIEAQKAFGQQTDPMDSALKLFQVVNATRAESSKSTEQMFGTLMKMFELQMKQQHSEAPKSVLEQLQEVRAIANEVRGSGGGDSGWGAFAASLPATLGGLAQVMHEFSVIRSAAAAAPIPGAPGVPVPVANPAAAQPAAGGADQGENMNLVELTRKLTDAGSKAMLAFERGEGGDEFAGTLYAWDPELYDALTRMGKVQILAMLRSQPALWTKLAPRAAEVEKFIDDFINAGQAEDSGPEAGPEVAA